MPVDIDALAENPRPPSYQKLLGGQDAWRIRVANTYRVIYEVHDHVLLVTAGRSTDERNLRIPLSQRQVSFQDRNSFREER
jgi:hypothetical protein